MHIRLPYGTDHVPVDVPDNWINGRCYRPQPLEPCADARAELMAVLSLLSPEDSLGAKSEGKASCVIAVDSEAPALMAELLPAVIEEIEDNSSIEASNIVVLLTNRYWNPLSPEDAVAMVPEGIRAHYRVILHDPAEADMIEDLGLSSKRVSLSINKAYKDADFKVILGGVRPDLIAGFTGGRAVLMPGLASLATLREIYDFNVVANRTIRYGSYRDNPFHIAGLETVQAAGCDFCISATLTPNGEICRLHAGHFGKSHIEAMNDLRDSMAVRVKESMDIVVAGGGGHPHDSSLAKLVSTLCSVEHVLKPDGTIVIAAGLADGLGPKDFGRLVKNHHSMEETFDRLSRAENFVPGQWVAQRLYTLLQAHEIIIYNDTVEEDLIWRTGLTPTRDMNEAILGAMESHGQRCKIVALPEGPFCIGMLGST